MLRNIRKIPVKSYIFPVLTQKQTFLTNDYKCTDAWNTINSSSLSNKINLNDFYNILDQNYSSKGVISAIDVDIFANAMKEPSHLEELKDLLHKLRMSAETGNMLESTKHATIRNFIEFDHIEELIEILSDPLNFGVFLDDYCANLLLDKLLSAEPNYELAAKVASLYMLQEDYSNEITCAMCQYACYKYISNFTPLPEPTPADEKNKSKVEEIKIRVKFLRNPYFDDHFDIKDILTLSGKTLAWISELRSDNVNNNLKVIGWLYYKKYDKLLNLCGNLEKSFKVFPEVIELLNKENERAEPEIKETIGKCISCLSTFEQISSETKLEKSLEMAIENAINRSQNNDILMQQQLFESWVKTRQEKLEEQTKRLDRAKRVQLINEKQKQMAEEEQKLWFFENEENLDLIIEGKEKLVEPIKTKKTDTKGIDEDYVPPEIVPKKK